MEINLSCRYCHRPINETDFFCPSCGNKLKNKPLLTSFGRQVLVILVSVLLPPFGMGWAFKYIAQEDAISKRLGWAIVVLTAISLVVMVKMTIDVANQVSDAVNQQMQLLQGY